MYKHANCMPSDPMTATALIPENTCIENNDEWANHLKLDREAIRQGGQAGSRRCAGHSSDQCNHVRAKQAGAFLLLRLRHTSNAQGQLTKRRIAI